MAVAQERPFSADDNERLMVWRAPLAHIREWVPDKFLVCGDQLVCVPLTHKLSLRESACPGLRRTITPLLLIVLLVFHKFLDCRYIIGRRPPPPILSLDDTLQGQ